MGHKIHGSVRYDTVVSRLGMFSIRGAGQLITSQCWKYFCFKPWRQANGYQTSTRANFVQDLCRWTSYSQSIHYKQKVKVKTEWWSNDGAFGIWRRVFCQRQRDTNLLQHADNGIAQRTHTCTHTHTHAGAWTSVAVFTDSFVRQSA